MICKRYIQRYAVKFSDYCGKHGDYLPDARLWICYRDNETVKKTTDEMMKDFEKENKKHDKNH